jgi:hypothetical protein
LPELKLKYAVGGQAGRGGSAAQSWIAHETRST